MITTDDDEIADRARLIRNHGQRERYYHEMIGYNFRMTEIQAAIGLVQLGKLEHFIAIRRANAAYLTRGLKGVIIPVEASGCRHVYHQYTIRVFNGRDRLVNHLKERGIATGIYYPLPVHKQPVYQRLGYVDQLPVAEAVSREVLALPVHPALTREELDQIIEGVNSLWS